MIKILFYCFVALSFIIGFIAGYPDPTLMLIKATECGLLFGGLLTVSLLATWLLEGSNDLKSYLLEKWTEPFIAQIMHTEVINESQIKARVHVMLQESDVKDMDCAVYYNSIGKVMAEELVNLGIAKKSHNCADALITGERDESCAFARNIIVVDAIANDENKNLDKMFGLCLSNKKHVCTMVLLHATEARCHHPDYAHTRAPDVNIHFVLGEY